MSRSLFLDPLARTCYVFRATRLRWAPCAWSLPSWWSMHSCTATRSTGVWTCSEELEKFLKTSVTKHVRLHIGFSRQRPADSPSFCDVHILQNTKSTNLTSLLVESTVDTLIDTLNTQTFVDHHILDSREHAHTPATSADTNRANFQRNCNSTDCHPSFPVEPL